MTLFNSPFKAASMAVLMLLTALCCNKINEKDKKLKGVRLMVYYPILFPTEGRIMAVDQIDTQAIYYYNDYILYKLSPTRNFENNAKKRGTEPYFIYKINEEYGYWHKSIKDSSKGIKYRVGSFLFNRAFGDAKFEPGLNDSLVQTISDEKNLAIEKYIIKTKNNENFFDSSYYYYNKTFNNIDLTFSRYLDSARGMKLYKIRLLHNGGYSPTYKVIMPKREFLFEMEPLPINDPEEIKSLFERFGKNINR